MALIYHAGFTIKEGDEEFATQVLKDLLLETGEISVHISGVSRNGNQLLLLFASCAIGLMTLNYIIIGFCVFKIQARLRILHPILSSLNRRMQSQISQILFIQATSPLVVSIIPLGYLCYIIISGGTAFWSTTILTMGFNWVPFTNAIITMTIIREFRPKISNFYKILTEKLPTQMTNFNATNTTTPWILSHGSVYIGETTANN
uniref:G protein-coupled receptor n=1 Tax=Panagrolaimus davidi TaxID=227884 RepID=A0A914PRA1_9BILA